MSENVIKIRGARVHNLKNIDVDIPKNKLVVITGISGSGKSSLAFDTLYAEGQRRYVESLSAYARQFLGVMQKPDVDKIEGISPAISIDQRKATHNPRSTVGTITEIYDYLRLLFARIGKPHCPKCGKEISRQTIDQITSQILKLPKNKEITILGPVVRGKKGEHQGILEEIRRGGFVRVRIDGIIYLLEEAIAKQLDKNKKHNIEVVVDRLILPARRLVRRLRRPKATSSAEGRSPKGEGGSFSAGGDKDLDKSRLMDSLETALKLGKGIVIIQNTKYLPASATPKALQAGKIQDTKTKSSDLVFSEHFACEDCGISLPELEPRLFSFNSPYGACPACQGLGEKLEVDPKLVIPNPNLTLDEGAIIPWARASHKVGRQGFFWWKLQDLAEKYNFDLNVPVKELPKNIIYLILYGKIQNTKYLPASATPKALQAGKIQDTDFDGVIPWLERRYHETDSDYAREEIGQYMVEKQCEVCRGKRLKPEVLAVTVMGKSIDELVEMSIGQIQDFFRNPGSKNQISKTRAQNKKFCARPSTQMCALVKYQKHKLKIKNETDKLTENEFKIADSIMKEIINRLQFLIDVGLDYLTLDRKADTLAGGEGQRIRLATQIGSKLTGVLYILDEPSIGLHARDQGRLIETLKKLRDLGNTVIVVEHSKHAIKAADWVIDIGPGAGKRGGRVTFGGTPRQLLRSNTLTGDYLAGRKKVEISNHKTMKPFNHKNKDKWLDGSMVKWLEIKGAREHNLKNIDVKIPLGKFVCITGVSGSGKSSLMNDILAKALLRKFYNAKEEPGKHEEILGTENLNKVVLVDQSPIGRTPRSNPATYTGAFSYIRDLFTKTKEARIRGYRAGRFSFNVKGGRCEACEGQGVKKIEMYFLPDVYVECEECRGKRFNKETLSIEYRDKNIAEVLEMTIEEALGFFKNIPGLYQKLKTLNDVGLGYIQLGQPAPSLSGGEAQRVKLATELSKKATGKTLYILDEPTTGLHPDDIKKLISVLRELVNRGNTVICIEHEVDVIKNTDYVIDLGPEGGDEGGYIVAEDTPSEISKNKKSYTGQYLKQVLTPTPIEFKK